MNTYAAVILIAGASASGKTTLARTLAGRLNLPVLSKDNIKETLFDALPVNDEWSRPLGHASYRLLLRLIAEFTRGSAAFIVDNAFRAEDELDLRRILTGASVLCLHCQASNAALAARAGQRVEAGDRHPSHHNADLSQLIASDIYAPPELGERATVPTDDFTSELYRAAVDDAILRATRLVAKQAACR